MKTPIPAVYLLISLAISAVLVCILLILRLRQRKQKNTVFIDALSGCYSEYGFYACGSTFISGKAKLYSCIYMTLPEARSIFRNYDAAQYHAFMKFIPASLKTLLGKDPYIGRMRDDSFVFLLQNRNPNEIRAKLDTICDSLNNMLANSPQDLPSLRLKPFFGIYLPEDVKEPIQDIVQKAYTANINIPQYRRYHFYDPETGEKNARDYAIACSIPKAIHAGELIVYFQPRVRISDQKVTGAEALVRWRRTQSGLLSPDMFLPPAEQFGVIEQIDRFVFEEVCRTLARWQKQERELCQIAVNLSAASVERPDLADECMEICRQYGVSPSQIEFELKEDSLLANPVWIKNLFEQFHAYGFHCAIDNFGASLCSLQLLDTLSIDTIKLDRSFFSGGNNNRHGRYIIESILRLAAQMHINTFAEGIENIGQVQYLRQAACDGIQGFYFFHPMPLEKLEHEIFDGTALNYITVEGDKNKPHPENTSYNKTALQSSRSVVLFSYHPEEDTVEFSDLFSPALGTNTFIKNALALFRTTDLIHENDKKDFLRLMERCWHESGWVENTLRFHMPHGKYEWLEVRLRRDNHLVSGMIADMSGWKNEVNRWKEKATRDPLTGLYNREHFEQNATALLEQKNHSRAALIFIDVDDFKRANDTYGHMFGDDVLCFVAKQILGVFRHTDLVARYAGDEFVVLAPSLDDDVLMTRLQKLLDTFRFPYRNDSIEYNLSISIGASVYPNDGTDYPTLLDHADCALYAAKESGKNNYVLYEPSLEGKSSKHTSDDIISPQSR